MPANGDNSAAEHNGCGWRQNEEEEEAEAKKKIEKQGRFDFWA